MPDFMRMADGRLVPMEGRPPSAGNNIYDIDENGNLVPYVPSKDASVPQPKLASDPLVVSQPSTQQENPPSAAQRLEEARNNLASRKKDKFNQIRREEIYELPFASALVDDIVANNSANWTKQERDARAVERIREIARLKMVDVINKNKDVKSAIDNGQKITDEQANDLRKTALGEIQDARTQWRSESGNLTLGGYIGSVPLVWLTNLFATAVDVVADNMGGGKGFGLSSVLSPASFIKDSARVVALRMVAGDESLVGRNIKAGFERADKARAWAHEKAKNIRQYAKDSWDVNFFAPGESKTTDVTGQKEIRAYSQIVTGADIVNGVTLELPHLLASFGITKAVSIAGKGTTAVNFLTKAAEALPSATRGQRVVGALAKGAAELTTAEGASIAGYNYLRNFGGEIDDMTTKYMADHPGATYEEAYNASATHAKTVAALMTPVSSLIDQSVFKSMEPKLGPGSRTVAGRFADVLRSNMGKQGIKDAAVAYAKEYVGEGTESAISNLYAKATWDPKRKWGDMATGVFQESTIGGFSGLAFHTGGRGITQALRSSNPEIAAIQELSPEELKQFYSYKLAHEYAISAALGNKFNTDGLSDGAKDLVEKIRAARADQFNNHPDNPGIEYLMTNREFTEAADSNSKLAVELLLKERYGDSTPTTEQRAAVEEEVSNKMDEAFQRAAIDASVAFDAARKSADDDPAIKGNKVLAPYISYYKKDGQVVFAGAGTSKHTANVNAYRAQLAKIARENGGKYDGKDLNAEDLYAAIKDVMPTISDSVSEFANNTVAFLVDDKGGVAYQEGLNNIAQEIEPGRRFTLNTVIESKDFAKKVIATEIANVYAEQGAEISGEQLNAEIETAYKLLLDAATAARTNKLKELLEHVKTGKKGKAEGSTRERYLSGLDQKQMKSISKAIEAIKTAKGNVDVVFNNIIKRIVDGDMTTGDPTAPVAPAPVAPDHNETNEEAYLSAMDLWPAFDRIITSVRFLLDPSYTGESGSVLLRSLRGAISAAESATDINDAAHRQAIVAIGASYGMYTKEAVQKYLSDGVIVYDEDEKRFLPAGISNAYREALGITMAIKTAQGRAAESDAALDAVAETIAKKMSIPKSAAIVHLNTIGSTEALDSKAKHEALKALESSHAKSLENFEKTRAAYDSISEQMRVHVLENALDAVSDVVAGDTDPDMDREVSLEAWKMASFLIGNNLGTVDQAESDRLIELAEIVFNKADGNSLRDLVQAATEEASFMLKTDLDPEAKIMAAELLAMLAGIGRFNLDGRGMVDNAPSGHVEPLVETTVAQEAAPSEVKPVSEVVEAKPETAPQTAPAAVPETKATAAPEAAPQALDIRDERALRYVYTLIGDANRDGIKSVTINEKGGIDVVVTKDESGANASAELKKTGFLVNKDGTLKKAGKVVDSVLAGERDENLAPLVKPSGPITSTEEIVTQNKQKGGKLVSRLSREEPNKSALAAEIAKLSIKTRPEVISENVTTPAVTTEPKPEEIPIKETVSTPGKRSKEQIEKQRYNEAVAKIRKKQRGAMSIRAMLAMGTLGMSEVVAALAPLVSAAYKAISAKGRVTYPKIIAYIKANGDNIHTSKHFLEAFNKAYDTLYNENRSKGNIAPRKHVALPPSKLVADYLNNPDKPETMFGLFKIIGGLSSDGNVESMMTNLSSAIHNIVYVDGSPNGPESIIRMNKIADRLFSDTESVLLAITEDVITNPAGNGYVSRESVERAYSKFKSGITKLLDRKVDDIPDRLKALRTAADYALMKAKSKGGKSGVNKTTRLGMIPKIDTATGIERSEHIDTFLSSIALTGQLQEVMVEGDFVPKYAPSKGEWAKKLISEMKLRMSRGDKSLAASLARIDRTNLKLYRTILPDGRTVEESGWFYVDKDGEEYSFVPRRTKWSLYAFTKPEGEQSSLQPRAMLTKKKTAAMLRNNRGIPVHLLLGAVDVNGDPVFNKLEQMYLSLMYMMVPFGRSFSESQLTIEGNPILSSDQIWHVLMNASDVRAAGESAKAELLASTEGEATGMGVVTPGDETSVKSVEIANALAESGVAGIEFESDPSGHNISALANAVAAKIMRMFPGANPAEDVVPDFVSVTGNSYNDAAILFARDIVSGTPLQEATDAYIDGITKIYKLDRNLAESLKSASRVFSNVIGVKSGTNVKDGDKIHAESLFNLIDHLVEGEYDADIHEAVRDIIGDDVYETGGPAVAEMVRAYAWAKAISEDVMHATGGKVNLMALIGSSLSALGDTLMRKDIEYKERREKSRTSIPAREVLTAMGVATVSEITPDIMVEELGLNTKRKDIGAIEAIEDDLGIKASEVQDIELPRVGFSSFTPEDIENNVIPGADLDEYTASVLAERVRYIQNKFFLKKLNEHIAEKASKASLEKLGIVSSLTMDDMIRFAEESNPDEESANAASAELINTIANEIAKAYRSIATEKREETREGAGLLIKVANPRFSLDRKFDAKAIARAFIIAAAKVGELAQEVQSFATISQDQARALGVAAMASTNLLSGINPNPVPTNAESYQIAIDRYNESRDALASLVADMKKTGINVVYASNALREAVNFMAKYAKGKQVTTRIELEALAGFVKVLTSKLNASRMAESTIVGRNQLSNDILDAIVETVSGTNMTRTVEQIVKEFYPALGSAGIDETSSAITKSVTALGLLEGKNVPALDPVLSAKLSAMNEARAEYLKMAFMFRVLTGKTQNKSDAYIMSIVRPEVLAALNASIMKGSKSDITGLSFKKAAIDKKIASLNQRIAEAVSIKAEDARALKEERAAYMFVSEGLATRIKHAKQMVKMAEIVSRFRTGDIMMRERIKSDPEMSRRLGKNISELRELIKTVKQSVWAKDYALLDQQLRSARARFTQASNDFYRVFDANGHLNRLSDPTLVVPQERLDAARKSEPIVIGRNLTSVVIDASITDPNTPNYRMLTREQLSEDTALRSVQNGEFLVTKHPVLTKTQLDQWMAGKPVTGDIATDIVGVDNVEDVLKNITDYNIKSGKRLGKVDYIRRARAIKKKIKLASKGSAIALAGFIDPSMFYGQPSDVGLSDVALAGAAVLGATAVIMTAAKAMGINANTVKDAMARLSNNGMRKLGDIAMRIKRFVTSLPISVIKDAIRMLTRKSEPTPDQGAHTERTERSLRDAIASGDAESVMDIFSDDLAFEQMMHRKRRGKTKESGFVTPEAALGIATLALVPAGIAVYRAFKSRGNKDVQRPKWEGLKTMITQRVHSLSFDPLGMEAHGIATRLLHSIHQVFGMAAPYMEDLIDIRNRNREEYDKASKVIATISLRDWAARETDVDNPEFRAIPSDDELSSVYGLAPEGVSVVKQVFEYYQKESKELRDAYTRMTNREIARLSKELELLEDAADEESESEYARIEKDIEDRKSDLKRFVATISNPIYFSYTRKGSMSREMRDTNNDVIGKAYYDPDSKDDVDLRNIKEADDLMKSQYAMKLYNYDLAEWYDGKRTTPRPMLESYERKVDKMAADGDISFSIGEQTDTGVVMGSGISLSETNINALIDRAMPAESQSAERARIKRSISRDLFGNELDKASYNRQSVPGFSMDPLAAIATSARVNGIRISLADSHEDRETLFENITEATKTRPGRPAMASEDAKYLKGYVAKVLSPESVPSGYKNIIGAVKKFVVFNSLMGKVTFPIGNALQRQIASKVFFGRIFGTNKSTNVAFRAGGTVATVLVKNIMGIGASLSKLSDKDLNSALDEAFETAKIKDIMDVNGVGSLTSDDRVDILKNAVRFAIRRGSFLETEISNLMGSEQEYEAIGKVKRGMRAVGNTAAYLAQKSEIRNRVADFVTSAIISLDGYEGHGLLVYDKTGGGIEKISIVNPNEVYDEIYNRYTSAIEYGNIGEEADDETRDAIAMARYDLTARIIQNADQAVAHSNFITNRANQEPIFSHAGDKYDFTKTIAKDAMLFVLFGKRLWDSWWSSYNIRAAIDGISSISKPEERLRYMMKSATSRSIWTAILKSVALGGVKLPFWMFGTDGLLNMFSYLYNLVFVKALGIAKIPIDMRLGLIQSLSKAIAPAIRAMGLDDDKDKASRIARRIVEDGVTGPSNFNIGPSMSAAVGPLGMKRAIPQADISKDVAEYLANLGGPLYSGFITTAARALSGTNSKASMSPRIMAGSYLMLMDKLGYERMHLSPLSVYDKQKAEKLGMSTYEQIMWSLGFVQERGAERNDIFTDNKYYDDTTRIVDSERRKYIESGDMAKAREMADARRMLDKYAKERGIKIKAFRASSGNRNDKVMKTMERRGLIE